MNRSTFSNALAVSSAMAVAIAWSAPVPVAAQAMAERVTVGGKNITSYLSVLEKTKKRMPPIDPGTMLHVAEVKPNLFYVTDGVYQSAFLKTGAGVIVFDAPPGYAAKLPAIIKQRVPDEAIKYVVYSHGHKDHIGGVGAFKNIRGLKVVAHEKVAMSLRNRKNPDILPPNVTFREKHVLRLGRETVELRAHGNFHSADADIMIYLPRQKFLLAIDTMSPGYVPFKDFEITPDLEEYMAVFGGMLAYDFDLVLAGHLGILGVRQDVMDSRDYVLDVKSAVINAITRTPPGTRLGKAVGAMKSGDNSYLVYRSMLESVAKECADDVVGKWQDKLSGVDVWAEGHCDTMLLYTITH